MTPLKQKLMNVTINGLQNYNNDHPEAPVPKSMLTSIAKRVAGRVESMVVQSQKAKLRKDPYVAELLKELEYRKTKQLKASKSVRYWMGKCRELEAQLNVNITQQMSH